MAGNLSIRASDADRDRVATVLRENLAAGRLTTDEFDERLEKAFAAKTIGQLEGLMTDLPATEPGGSGTSDRGGGNPPSARGRFYPVRRTASRPLLVVAVLVLVIWLFSGAHASLALLWVVAALAVLLVGRRLMGGRHGSERRSGRPRRSRTRRGRAAGP